MATERISAEQGYRQYDYAEFNHDHCFYCAWMYFIESITSVGPMDPKRIVEIEAMTKNVTAGKIYISALLDFSTFKKFSDQLAWETEVWIADMPDHMIHLNGDKFLGPR